MNFSIYTWGYGTEMYEVLTAVQFFVANPFYLIATALAFGLSVVAFKSVFSQIDEKWAFMSFFVIIGLFLTPSNQTFVIEDEATGNAQPISNIPIGIGLALTLESNFERSLSAMVKDAYSTPNSIAMESVGIGFSMTASLDIEDAMPRDDLLVQTFDHYVNNCILSALATGEKTMTTLTNSGNLAGDLAVSNTFETLVFDTADPTGRQESCQTAWANVAARMDIESNTFIQNKISPLMGLPVDRVNDGLAGTANLIYGVSTSGKELVLQKMTKNLLNNGLMAVGQIVGGDTATAALMAAQTEQQTKGAWIGAGMQAQKTLPMIRIIGTSLLIATIPILAWFSIATASLKVLAFIGVGLMTLATWQPIATIINYLFYSRLEKILQPVSGGVLAPIQSTGYVNDVVQNYLANLMWWYSAIPMFSYTILTMSGMGMMYMMRDASSSSTGANTGTNIGAGKIDMGNTNVGNHAMDNDKIGTGTYVGADGITTRTNSNGGTETSNIGTTSDGTSFKTETLNSLGGTATSVNTGGAGTIGLDAQGQIRSMSGANWGAGIDSAQQHSQQQAIANEQTAQTQFSHAVGKSITDAMRSGSNVTDSSNLAKTLGLDHSSASTLSSVTSQAVGKAFTSAFSEKEQSDIMKRVSASAGIGAEAGVTLGTPGEGIFGSGASAKVVADGRVEVSGVRADGTAYTASLNSEESQRYMQNYEKSLSQSLTEKEGLSLDIAKNMSITNAKEHAELKNAQDTYSQAHSMMEKNSETFSRVSQYAQSNNIDLSPRILSEFIQNDERLGAKWNMQGSDHASIAAEAANRIQNAQLDPNGNGVDARNFQNSVSNVYSEFARANGLSGTVDNAISSSQINATQTIAQGKDGIEDFNISPVDTKLNTQTSSFYNAAGSFKGEAGRDMSVFNNSHALNLQSSIVSNADNLSNAVITKQGESTAGTVLNKISNADVGSVSQEDVNKLIKNNLK